MRALLECAILGALMKGPMHGYDIHRSLSSALKEVWRVGMSNTYGLLKKLESENHVHSTLEMQETRPAKKVFAITDKGEALFEAWVSSPVHNIRDMRVEFMTKLYFLRSLGLPEGEALIAKQQCVCHGILETMRSRGRRSSDFCRLLFDFRACQIRAILSWLEECRSFLQSAPKNGWMDAGGR